MGKKAIDSRIPALIRNGAQQKQRSFFIIVGDKARNQLPNLHYLMMSADLKMNKLVLWAYKKELLGFTSHRKKREAKIKKEIKRGQREANELDPFEAFISNQNIRYVYYKETEKVLGNTYGMCILQDFEALTPNLLARTIETVEGGGIVVMLLKLMSSLKQLYTMNMDVHLRYRTEAHGDVVARFNERFLLLLGLCATCLVVDDELNVLPVSGGKHVRPLPPADDTETPAQRELATLKESLADVQPAGLLVNLAKTVNQAQAILTFVDVILEKTLRLTVALTAGRGRGKSAALGVAIAGAVAHGYANIFVTSPSPENLKTLFAFVFLGFDALGYTEHMDYDIIQLSNPAFNKAIVRVDIKRALHRQTIQYIAPHDHHVLGQAELVVIDEAAAIPLPVVRKLLGPFLVFMASTINGYEGTGRSLSLKLILQLRAQLAVLDGDGAAAVGRNLREVVLDEPIRYAPGDPVELWLNKLLCLDATTKSRPQAGTPHPGECTLFNVNRDTLFLYHPVLETFLQKMMALYVALHYKNTPNDLQLMSDAPAHQLYVLLPPVDANTTRIPDPLCVVQVALEGEISKESVRRALARGHRAGGDLIPWLVAQQFQDDDFASLSGARVVRIATNPDYAGMGYGLRALELLQDYFEGKFADLSEHVQPTKLLERVTDAELQSASLKDEVKLRDAKLLPPLLLKLLEVPPPALHYVGVSYGMTPQLHKFWRKAGFVPVYLRQTANELTGEHTSVMLRVLGLSPDAWLEAFAADFHRRFLNLLLYEFHKFPASQALGILELTGTQQSKELTRLALDEQLLPFDLKRLDSYANNLLDYHVILDLMPLVGRLWFAKLTSVSLSSVQAAILLAVALQHKLLDDVAKELNIPPLQAMAMFSKIIRKFALFFRSVLAKDIELLMPEIQDDAAEMDGEVEHFDGAAAELAMTQDLDAAGDSVVLELRSKQKELINALNLDKYAINDNVAEWDDKAAEKAVHKLGVVSMKSKTKRKSENAEQIRDAELKSAKKAKKPKRK